MKAELLFEANNRLGEGPVWDFYTNEFLWIDIEQKRIWCYSEFREAYIISQLNERISLVVPTNQVNLYLVGLENGLALWDRQTNLLKTVSNPESHIPNNRFNDGKCDAYGRLWIGSMSLSVEKNAGSLYCTDSDFQSRKLLSGITISNGIDWSPDNKIMYFIDTATRAVSAFDFDLKTAQISNRLEIIHFPEEHGSPDGMCVDCEGMLWIAHWGGAGISRWNPVSGELLEKIEIPALNAGSLCFGGKNLDTIFITSAKEGLTAQELDQYPLSGSVFIYKPKVRGRKTNTFKMQTR